MKRIFLCALAACFVLTACEIQNPVEIPDVPAASGVSGDSAFGSSSKDSILFSANLGADTKTYLEYDGNGFYKQLWSESDRILIWDGNTLENGEKAVYEFCDIYKGVGTASASFLGTLKTDSYVALYAEYLGYPQDGFPVISLPTKQYRNRVNNLADFAYPMIAISDSRELNFDNMCSILKLSVTGNGELISCITAYSQAGEPMSGPVAVDVDTETLKPVIEFLGESESDGVYSFVDLYCNYSESLSSSPTEFYIVVPAQVYEEGIGFTLITDDGLTMDVTTAAGIETKRSQMHEISVNFENEGEEVEGYARCQLELVGTSVASGTADASSWKWGNVLMAANSGYPTVDGATYTWTWNTYLYDESDCVSNMSGTPGFKIRTPDYLGSGGVAAFDLGYGSVDTDASSVVSSYDLDNIMVGESGLYDVTLTYDAYSDEFTITLLLTSLQ